MANKFNYFGVMLDVSRNAVHNLDMLKRYFPLLKKMGYNCVFLYMEDTYTVEEEPYFGYMRGRYTEQEMREIDELGAANGIEVIPCIQTLAHLKTFLTWKNTPYDCADILLAGDDRTYELISHMFDALAKCFRSRKIHVGMDEAHMLGRGKYFDKHGLHPVEEIMKLHLNKVCEIASKHGYEVLLWSDMYMRAFNDGDYYLKDYKKVPKNIIDSVPDSAIPVYWDYYHDDERIYDVNIDAHRQINKNVWFAGGAWTWGGFMPHNRYSLKTMLPAIRSARKNKVKNVFITIWGDDGAECSRMAILPCLFAISEWAKGNEDMELIKAKFKRAFGLEFDEFMLLDAPNEIKGREEFKPNRIVNASKYMLYSDYFNGHLDYTVVGGEGEKYAELAVRLAEVAKKSRRFGYVFNSAAKLCEALVVKYELGVKTRSAYQAGDKKTLEKLAKVDYVEAEKKIRAYADVFEKQWFIENKPCGFDVQDVRLGTVLRRTVTCRRRLLDYVAGRVDSIPELEEKIIPWPGCTEPEPVFCNNACEYLTVNALFHYLGI